VIYLWDVTGAATKGRERGNDGRKLDALARSIRRGRRPCREASAD